MLGFMDPDQSENAENTRSNPSTKLCGCPRVSIHRRIDDIWLAEREFFHEKDCHILTEEDMWDVDCVFCMIARGLAAVTFLSEWSDGVAFEPLNPVTPGHVLVVPRWHVSDVSQDPALAGLVMEYACDLAAATMTEFNIITSAGSAATQTIGHMHLHLIPRWVEDGLKLPWSGDE